MIKIITDSSSNISQEEAKSLGITVLPLSLSFGDEQYLDGIDITAEQFYKKLTEQKDFPHTSQLCETALEEAYANALKEADEVLVLPIASALSGSYDRAKVTAEKFNNVYIYDSKCTTVMLKMLVLEALKHSSKSAREVMAILDGFRPKIKLFAALDTLEYLKRGGRLSKTSALIGTMLKIKPVVIINCEGKVELVSKQFGFSKAVNFIAENVDINSIDFTKPVYRIYTMDEEHSLSLLNKIGVKCSDETNICPVIGAHIGPFAAGFVYAEK